jgi:hypothetical protein
LPADAKTGLREGSGGVNRGKLAVVSILLLAVGLAGFAWWFIYSKSQRPIAFWGVRGKERIQHAPQVELLWLRHATGSTGDVTIHGKSYIAFARQDISTAPGSKNGRDALLRDDSYVWNFARGNESQADYTFALRFRDASGTTTAAFDLERELIAHVEMGREQKAAAKIVTGWKTFAERHAPAKDDPQSSAR